jgi:hypothetical protein
MVLAAQASVVNVPGYTYRAVSGGGATSQSIELWTKTRDGTEVDITIEVSGASLDHAAAAGNFPSNYGGYSTVNLTGASPSYNWVETQDGIPLLGVVLAEGINGATVSEPVAGDIVGPFTVSRIVGGTIVGRMTYYAAEDAGTYEISEGAPTSDLVGFIRAFFFEAEPTPEIISSGGWTVGWK